MITIAQGANKTLLLTVTDENGAAANLTGAAVWVTVKHRTADAPAAISKRNTAAGGNNGEILIASPATLGTAQVFYVPADTSGLNNLVTYSIDAWVRLVNGNVYQVVAPDTFVIGPTVTTTF